MLIDRVGDLTHPIPVFPDDTIRDELVHEVIIGIKTHAFFIRDDTHQEFFKPLSMRNVKAIQKGIQRKSSKLSHL